MNFTFDYRLIPIVIRFCFVSERGITYCLHILI